MKLWVGDVRTAPDGYKWCRTVNEAKWAINYAEEMFPKTNVPYYKLEIIDLDHDAGDYAIDGGDYIKLLDWLEETGRNYPIHIHSMNSVGVENMRRIIKRNGWTEVK